MLQAQSNTYSACFRKTQLPVGQKSSSYSQEVCWSKAEGKLSPGRRCCASCQQEGQREINQNGKPEEREVIENMVKDERSMESSNTLGQIHLGMNCLGGSVK